MSRERVLLVRIDREDLLRSAESGGLVLKLVVTHANMKVEVEDDAGVVVEFKRAELTGTKEVG